VTAENVGEYLGRPRFFDEVVERTSRPGVATGLAWTPVGGDVLFVRGHDDASTEDRLVLTGMLGDVMRESARPPCPTCGPTPRPSTSSPSSSKARPSTCTCPPAPFPKDGPSAGVTMVTALASYATRRPVRSDVAMTGEITLRGKVLPVGGIKEKVLAAHRVGIRTVILPRHNERDVEDVPAEVRAALRFVLVDDAEEALRQALTGGVSQPPASVGGPPPLDDHPLRMTPRAAAELQRKRFVQPQPLGCHADLARRQVDGRRQTDGADEPGLLPEKRVDQLVRRSHTRTILMASWTVSSGPEIRSLAPCRSAVISRVCSSAWRSRPK